MTVPAQVKVTAGQGLSAVGTVPSADARYLITTFGITGSVAISTAGAVVILRASASFALRVAPYIALADLALGLVAAILIAVCGRRHRTGSRLGPDQ